MPNDRNRNYEIGYGRPPAKSRFRKGLSDNPKGRPQGSKNPSKLLDDARNERVVVTENGKGRRITKREAVLKQLVNKAASGNPRAIQMLLAEMRMVEGREQDLTEGVLFDEADQEVIRQLYHRFRVHDADDTVESNSIA
jgi:Family of unknown function (DUF5681)